MTNTEVTAVVPVDTLAIPVPEMLEVIAALEPDVTGLAI